MTPLTRGRAVAIFAAFAFAYFFSALIRAVTATLAPTLVQEFALNARDLGLLAGGYFLGFAATQLPLGNWLDRLGPKRVIVTLLSVGVVGCIAFSMATSFAGLLAARILCGVGVSACLMAPLTGYRRWYAPDSQMRANAWMLMVGSFGMVASTLPVQWLMPVLGWRGLFLGLAALVALAMVLIAWQVPGWTAAAPAPPPEVVPGQPAEMGRPAPAGYGEVWQSRYFRSLVPLGFFGYGGLVAMQTLWAAPGMVKVAGYSALEAATGMFWLNVAMLTAFWLWGMAIPRLLQRGYTVARLIRLGMPLNFVVLAIIVIAGHAISTASAAVWALYCVSCTVVSLSQPAVGMAFRPELAGRALSAYNLVIFCGVFAVQWGVGLLIDALQAIGLAPTDAYRGAIAVFGVCCMASYGYFVAAKQP